MREVTATEILDPTAYAGLREAFREQIIEYKRSRRVELGPKLTFVFENRRTVRWQIQEMVYVERIVDPDALAAEVAPEPAPVVQQAMNREEPPAPATTPTNPNGGMAVPAVVHVEA